MQATAGEAAWSAWAGWALPRELLERRRARVAAHALGHDLRALGRDARVRAQDAHDLGGDWPRVPAQGALLSPKQIRDLIRLENAMGRAPTAPPAQWLRPDPIAYWRVQDFLQNARYERPLQGELPADGAGGASAGGARPHGWEGAAWGWAGGAVLLAVLVLLVRALERFLHRKLFKGRRRPSEEWPTPNVLATSHQFGSDIDPPPRLDDSDAFPSDGRDDSDNDLPPPYSECANNDMPLETIDPNKPIGIEEPPPPYSACYFSNPKDGIPAVHLSRRSVASSELGQSSSDPHNEPSVSIVTSQESDRISDVGCETNVSVDNNVNGAVTSSNGNASEVADTEGAQGGSGRRRESPDHVVDIVEPGSSAGRAVAV